MKRPSQSLFSRANASRPLPHSRRGVSSVLAMMFLVIFSSLAAAMAVVAQGNLRTADSGLKMSRAMSAAEAGMTFATRRLSKEASRFVVEKGVVDAGFADRIWMGTYISSDGPVTILQPTGYNTGPGVIHAVRDAHLTDEHNISAPGAPDTPTIDQAAARLRVPAITLSSDANSPYFVLTYELLANVPYIRVKSEGVDGHITRTLEMDFRIDKKIEFAILSPNRVMIGKNVLVEGPLGTHYGLNPGELNSGNGDPLVMRSDFYYLDDDLDAKLEMLFDRIKLHDADGDGRLRPNHPVEQLGLNHPDLADADGDQYVDDFDLFLAHFDANNNHNIAYDAALAAAAGLGTLVVEYGDEETDDRQLLRLIDEAYPDRDADGTPGTSSDTALGWRDGVIDAKDQYAKVRGRLAFAVSRSAWETAKGSGVSYQQIVKGAIRHGIDVPPVKFEVTTDEMRQITTDMFSDSATWFSNTGVSALGSPDSVQSVPEPVPFGAAEISGSQWSTRGAYDYYFRPVYNNRTFTNVRIPRGSNALFNNCTFIGVTFVDTNAACSDVNWNFAGARKKTTDINGQIIYTLVDGGMTANNGAIPDTRVESNNVRFDSCTFLGSLAGTRPQQYTHWRNKIQLTGNTRFYLDPDDPELLSDPDPNAASWRITLQNFSEATRQELEKSSIYMPGWSVDVGNFTNVQGNDPEDTPKVKLKGTIISGILDVRGTADVHGTLLMTYRPIPGEGPLFYGGLPDAFNTTIGYFHSSDGDAEGGDPGDLDFEGFGEITLRYNPDAKLPDGIPWPIRIDADPTTYVE